MFVIKISPNDARRLHCDRRWGNEMGNEYDADQTKQSAALRKIQATTINSSLYNLWKCVKKSFEWKLYSRLNFASTELEQHH